MRLKDKRTAPVGGFYYIFSDEKEKEYRVNGYGGSFNALLSAVRTHMARNGVTIPSNLEDYIEDQICSRQPPDRCFYEKKAGDQISKGIHTFASGADKVAQVLGVKTQLEKKARGCIGCAKRRMAMNK